MATPQNRLTVQAQPGPPSALRSPNFNVPPSRLSPNSPLYGIRKHSLGGKHLGDVDRTLISVLFRVTNHNQNSSADIEMLYNYLASDAADFGAEQKLTLYLALLCLMGDVLFHTDSSPALKNVREAELPSDSRGWLSRLFPGKRECTGRRSAYVKSLTIKKLAALGYIQEKKGKWPDKSVAKSITIVKDDAAPKPRASEGMSEEGHKHYFLSLSATEWSELELVLSDAIAYSTRRFGPLAALPLDAIASRVNYAGYPAIYTAMAALDKRSLVLNGKCDRFSSTIGALGDPPHLGGESSDRLKKEPGLCMLLAISFMHAYEDNDSAKSEGQGALFLDPEEIYTFLTIIEQGILGIRTQPDKNVPSLINLMKETFHSIERFNKRKDPEYTDQWRVALLTMQRFLNVKHLRAPSYKNTIGGT